ncbi:MAG: hypothetical protein LBV74_23050 [Tannerella sp.]|jgi:hypothetical protein|nr:hypothetical protein [Tannerella sp.]
MDGWIKLHRELLDKPIWISSTPEQKTILVAILLMVNHEEKKWEWKENSFVCKPGQIVTSLEGIKKIAGKNISIQNIRSALLRFEKLNFLTSKPTACPTMLPTMLGRLITVCNWESYQSSQQCDQQGTQQGTQQGNQQLLKNNIIHNNPPVISKEITSPLGDGHPGKEKKPRKKKEKPEVGKEATLHSSARKIFEARYHRETREQYYWTAKDAGNMTSLLKALKFQREQKGLSNDDDTEVLAALATFINSAVKDEWIRKNLSVPVLFSKFNEIVARAKEERKNRHGTTGENTDDGAIAQPSASPPKDYSARF